MLGPPTGLLLNAVTGVAAWPLFLLLGGCATLIPVGGLGLPLTTRALGAVRALAGFHRSRAARVLGRETTTRTGPGRTARDLAWLAVHAVVGPSCLLSVWALFYSAKVILYLRTAESSPMVSLTLSLSVIAFVATGLAAIPLLHTLHARLTELLSRPSPEGRIRELTESRAAVLDAQAAELRRIERDLHDGVQARLISMRMNLGLIKNMSDAEPVRELAREAYDTAGEALAELRALVRGIHPPVLADRGLTGAIRAAALLYPIPVEVDIDLPARPEPPVESAVYFAAVEALNNVAKHSGATKAWVRLSHSGDVLRLSVIDNGRGGADPAAGTGLEGIRCRLSAFDGTLTVHSPPGGPSEITMELPCALSSQKILHS